MKVRHYKGGLYNVLINGTSTDLEPSKRPTPNKHSGALLATHTETLEPMLIYRVRNANIFYTDDISYVVYQSFEDGNIWARPKDMFWGSVTANGVLVPRFKEILK